MQLDRSFSVLFALLWTFFLLFSALSFLNKNYNLPFKSDTASTQTDPIPEKSEPTNAQVTTNPDGSKDLTVSLCVSIHFSAQLSGNYFSSQRYTIYNFAMQFQRLVGDLLEKFRDNYIDVLLALIAFTAISFVFKRKVFALFF
jgi:hypothetical protein